MPLLCIGICFSQLLKVPVMYTCRPPCSHRNTVGTSCSVFDRQTGIVHAAWRGGRRDTGRGKAEKHPDAHTPTERQRDRGTEGRRDGGTDSDGGEVQQATKEEGRGAKRRDMRRNKGGRVCFHYIKGGEERHRKFMYDMPIIYILCSCAHPTPTQAMMSIFGVGGCFQRLKSTTRCYCPR